MSSRHRRFQAQKKLVFKNGFQSAVVFKKPTRSRSAPASCYLFFCGRRKGILECHTSYSLQRMPCEECYRTSIICFLKFPCGQAKRISKRYLWMRFFLIKNGEKESSFSKISGTYGQDLKHEMLDSILQA